MSDDKEMPKYKCHKTVHALQIEKLELEGDGGAILTPADERYAPFKIPVEYMDKHNPQEGGYYVVYHDGYKSYSPADAFEDGYELVEEETKKKKSK
jgi:hypothetical protein